VSPLSLPADSADSASLPTVSAVIPTYNRSHMLRPVVEPLLRDPAISEVIVVVDGSPDDSAEVLEAMAEGEPRLRPHVIENSGRNPARWAGARVATGDVILFLDDDVVASDGLGTGHARRQAEARGRLVVGYMPIAERVASSGATSRMYADEYERTADDYERNPDEILRRLWGGNLSIWREDLERSGCMDDHFVADRHVDRHFGLCCSYAGLTAVFDRSLHATHEHERSPQSFARDAREQGEGLYWIHAVHGNALGPLPFERISAGLPPGLPALLRLARRPGAYELLSRALRWLSEGAGEAGLKQVEVPALRLLRRIEQQHGILRASRDAASGQRERVASSRS
jgi:GT2 family glycosyltransferase